MERAAQAVSPLHVDGNVAADIQDKLDALLDALMQVESLRQLKLCRQYGERGDEYAAARAWKTAAAIAQAGNLLRETEHI